MPIIKAAQHIYANVEKEQSPHNRGGFQTLFYTQSALTRTEVSDMEPNLLYFPSETEAVKKVFFTTATDKVVLGQIVPLPDPDSAGRGGRYLAHSFIFTRADFDRLPMNPIRMFRQLPFAIDLDKALALDDFKTGDIPTANLNFPEESEPFPQGFDHWSGEALQKLFHISLNADRMAREKTTVAITGTIQEIENTLETAFFALPLTQRAKCSFDTYFYRCNLVATYYWGVGLERAVSPNLLVVDAHAGQVMKILTKTDGGAYEHWVLASIEADKIADIRQHKETAFAIGEFLHSRTASDAVLDNAPDEIIHSVFQAAPSDVRQRLILALNEQLPAPLTERIFEPIYTQSESGALFTKLRRGFNLTSLLDALYDLYVSEQGAAPDNHEKETLAQFIDAHDHQNLRLLLAFWNGPAKLRHELENLNEADYTRFARQALGFEMADRMTLLKKGDWMEAFKSGVVTPLTMLTPGKGENFVKLYLETYREEDRDWPGLVEALVETGETRCLPILEPYIPDLKAKEIRALKRSVSKLPDAPASFCRTVSNVESALTRSKGFKRALRKFFD